MADIHNITRTCEGCGGTGEEGGMSGDPPVPVTTDCAKCGATGRRIVGTIHDDLIDKLNDMEDKINDIFEKVNE